MLIEFEATQLNSGFPRVSACTMTSFEEMGKVSNVS